MAAMRMFQILWVVLVGGIIFSAVYAFAAANTGMLAAAGDGSNTVSGFSITNIDYTLNTTNPSMLDAVSFTLDSGAKTVKVKLNAAGSVWYSCLNVTGNDWFCATAGEIIATVDELRVTASNH